MKLWKLSDSVSHDAVRNCDVYLVASFMSPFGARIMCLDASVEEEVSLSFLNHFHFLYLQIGR